MSDSLVTVATFWDSAEANLAHNKLQAAGLTAFLADAEAVGMAWHLGNALHGIKLQVRQADAEEATALQEEHATSDHPTAGPAPEHSQARAAEPARADGDNDESETRTIREQTADRALRAVLGMFILPLQLYVFWLLLKVYFSDERLGPKSRTRAFVAAAINLPCMVCFCLVVRTLLGD